MRTFLLSPLATMAVCATPALSQPACTPRLVPSAIPHPGQSIAAMTVFDDDRDGVPSLVALLLAPFPPSSGSLPPVVKFNGSAWVGVGTGLAYPQTTAKAALAVLGSGAGAGLYAGTGSGVYRLSGGAWALVPGSAPDSYALAVHHDGSGETLYSIRTFSPPVVKLVNGQFVPLGQNGQVGTPFQGAALVSYDFDGAGPQPARLVYATPSLSFNFASFTPYAVWNGAAWAAGTPSAGAGRFASAVVLPETNALILAAQTLNQTPQPPNLNDRFATLGTDGSVIAIPSTFPTNQQLRGIIAFHDGLGPGAAAYAFGPIPQVWRVTPSSATPVAIPNARGVAAFQLLLELPARGGGTASLLVDVGDGRLHLLAGCPNRLSDIDLDGQTTVMDILFFLDAWFSPQPTRPAPVIPDRDPALDFDANDRVDVADIFAFLQAWFAGL